MGAQKTAAPRWTSNATNALPAAAVTGTFTCPMKRPPRPISKPDTTPLVPASGSWPTTLIFGLFFLIALAVYFPALNGDFLWDDAGHVTNPALQSWSGLMRIWFEPGATQQ